MGYIYVHRKGTRLMPKLFKNANVKTVFLTGNVIKKHLTLQQRQSTEGCNNSGAYKLKCKTCNKLYIGQADRRFKTGFRERTRAIQYNQDNSIFAHVLNTTRCFGTIQETTRILRKEKEGRYLDTLEKYIAYSNIIKENNLLNET